MGKAARKTTRRIMALLLSITMIMSNMTVYAGEYSEFEQQTESPAENTETGTAELSSAEEAVEDAKADAAELPTTEDVVENTETSVTEDKADENLPKSEDLETEEVSDNLEAKEFNEDTAAHTIWVVGDSTVCSFNDKYYYPRYGYGTQIENFLSENSGYTVNNQALSGRSSLSFLSEGNYETLKAGIKAGDILIVGFGHNDEKAEADRYTNPNGTSTTAGSFAKNLYDNYVKMAKDKGAEVILCTPIVRRGIATGSDGKTKLSDSQKHITSASGSYEGGDYRKAIVDLGTEVSVPVVDLTTLTANLYESMTPEETIYYHAWTQSKNTSVDNTHLNIYGAKYVAYMLTKEIKEKGLTALAGAIDSSKLTAPTKAADLDTVYPVEGWKDPSYTAPDADPETVFDPYVIGEGDDQVKFIGTAFGNIGGDNKVSNFTLETDNLGNMHMVGTGNGKLITSGADSDGFAMYYYRVPKDSMFKISATAVVNSIANEVQSSFGLMARDDMYINKSKEVVSNTNYVAAGTSGNGAYNCFYRADGAFNSKAGLTVETVKAGESYDLSIVRNTDGYACTFGKEPTQSGGYDISLLATDSEYIYVGMFLSRTANITFKNIYLEVDGQVVADTRKIEYTVTVTDDGNGTASANSPASKGETITLTATPEEGFVLDHWEVVSAEGEKINVVNNKFTMPASNVTVNAVFAESEFDYDEVVEKGNKDFTPTGVQLTGFAGIIFANIEDLDNSHGFHTKSSGNPIMNLHLEEGRKASITVTSCCYGAGGGGQNPDTSFVESSSGVVMPAKVLSEESKGGREYSILNIEDEYVTLTFANDMYIHNIMVEYAAEVPDERKIDVWDFGAKAEEDTELYNNNITSVEWIAYKDSIPSGKFSAAGDYSFGDVTITGVVTNDRLYSNVSELSSISQGANYADKSAAGDDYVSAGVYYCNGTGGASRRYLTIENVQAGDKIVLYMGVSNGGSSDTVHFAGLGGASKQDDTFELSQTIQKQEFIAKHTGTYKIYAAASGGGKPVYYRVMRIPGVKVSGTIALNGIELPEGYSVLFVNQTTNGETVAELGENEDNEPVFTATLAPGYTYKAALNGATGYGFTNDSANNIPVEIAEIFTGKSDVTLVVEEKDTYNFSGKIKGFAADYAKLDDLKIILTPPETSNDDKIDLNIVKGNDGSLTFDSTLSPDVEYSLKMEGVNDYEVVAPEKVQKLSDGSGNSYENRTITVAPKAKYNVSGGFMYLPDDANVKALTFTNLEDKYVYNATISNGGYSIELRDGEYLAAATVADYTTNTHVVVNGGAVSKDLMFVSTVAKTSIPYAADIYVGYPDKTNNYVTVSEAMEACALMDRSGDNKDARITVHIAPGTYREQIMVTAPNVSLVNDSDEEVLLTWYYGIGYKYYSSDGYYNAERAYDKYEKKIAEKWGTAVYVKNTATSFRAEGITFENSFNLYVTEEEIADGVEVSGTESISFVRNLTSDVTSKPATERATAIAIEANYAEFKNCSFYSSQDTLYTAASVYFKDCIIEGQTDYIFGSGNCVFDSCELSWKGYSIGSQGGYITANRPTAGELGYLFRNCTVTANAHNSLTVTPGYWGRPWGQEATVKFMNTKLQTESLILAAGWTDMSGATAAKAHYSEYRTIAMDGTEVKPSSTRPIMSDAEAAAVDVKKYFGESWTPAYYTADSDTTVEIQGDLTLSDNGDINYVLPGHTLTVGYALNSAANTANDASVIRWYTVKYENGTAGTPKLVKTASGAIDKTYKVSKDDIGSYIKVTVTPETVSGKSGTAKEFTLYKDGDIDHIVNDGYYDPSTGSSSALGDGINIFLAGDSTTKDYSENGMYNNGKADNLGSWGEFFQNYFDESEVKIQNYANGGRSTRSFINDGSFDKIKAQIGAGDYLFIQFAHNDASAIASKKDVYVPLGEPDEAGIYPYTSGEKVNGKYPDYKVSAGSSDSDNGTATYKWFLKQYVDMALDAGATPVLLTPVARMYVNDSDGKMKDHHIDEGSAKKEAFGYCKAVEQVYNDYKAEGKNVLFVDAYTLTADLYINAWNEDDLNALNRQVMCLGDSTHSNKLGGMLTAAAYAQELQKMDITISSAVKAPGKVSALTVAAAATEKTPEVTGGNTVFNIDENGKFTAYDLTKDCSERAAYWESIGTTMFTAIKAKADELATSTEAGAVETPTAALSAEPNEAGEVESGTTVTLGCTTEGAKIYFTTDGSNPVVSKTRKEYVAGTTVITLTEDTTIKAYATKTDMKDSKVAAFKYTLAPLVKAPTSDTESGTAVKAGTVIKLQTATTTDGVQIRYTMGANPADPTKYSVRYDDETGIVITADTTIKAIAVAGNNVSAISTFTYTIDTTQSTLKPEMPTSDTPDGAAKIGDVIKLSTATIGAKIYYTIGADPEDPTTSNADIYDDEGITISSSAKIKAVAIKDGVSSDVAEFSYTVPTTSVPTLTPGAGVVKRGSSVTLKVTAEADTTLTNLTIYYTTDRSNPKTSETRVKVEGDTAEVTINDDTTIKAYATSDGLADSEVVSAKYTLESAPAPTASPDPAEIMTIGGTATLSVTAEEGVNLENLKIHYTTDGSNPKSSETTTDVAGATVSIVINNNTTIRAYTSADGYKDSSVVRFEYKVPTTEKPATDVKSGTKLNVGTKVTLTSGTEGAEIWYTTALGADAADVAVTDLTTKYNAETGIVINDNTVIYAYAKSEGRMDSDILKLEYTVYTTANPKAKPASGTKVKIGDEVTLSCSTKGAKIYYTTTLGADAENVTVTDLTTEYNAETKIVINDDTVIYACARRDGYKDSDIVKFVYTIAPAANPKANVESGAVSKGTAVTLSSDTEGAEIYYTTKLRANATDVSVSDLTDKYETEIVIDKYTVIWAYAKADKLKDSEIVMFEYRIGTGSGDSDVTVDKDGGIEILELEESYPYTGAKITPDFKVVDNGIIVDGESKVLTLGIDYTVKYTNNTKPGTATVTVIGKGNYVGKTVTATFKIEEVKKVETADLADLTGAKLDKIAAQDYTGEPCYPNFKLTLKGKSPVEYHYDSVEKQYVKSDGTTDVNVALSNNINKGTATILITGKMGPKKVTSVKKTFKINAVDLSKAGNKLVVNVADGESSVPYAVKGAMPKVEVSYKFSDDNEVELVNGKDYTVKYSANKKPGAGTVTITGKGNYAKKSSKTFKIDPLDLSNTKLVAVTAYEGLKAGKVKATVVDGKGDMLKASQYTVKVYKDEDGTQGYNASDVLKKGDTIYVKAEAKDIKNLKDKTATELVEFTVGENFAKAKVKLNVKSKAYTGAEIELEPSDLTVTIKGAPAPLKLKPADADSDEGYDYEIVSYSNNINKGTATAVIKGIGKYSGTKTVKFKIAAKEMKKQTTTTNN